MINREISEVSTEELLNLVNKALYEGLSVNKFSEKMGWGNSSVKTRLKRGGYCYSKVLNSYVLITDSDTNNNTNKDTKTITKRNINNITKINTKEIMNKDTKSNTKNIINKNLEENTKKDTKENINIEELINKIEKMDNRLSKLEKKKDIKRDKYYIENTRDTSTKSIRLYTEVKEQLEEYLSNHKEKKVIEVFSHAILEYINKYK